MVIWEQPWIYRCGFLRPMNGVDELINKQVCLCYGMTKNSQEYTDCKEYNNYRLPILLPKTSESESKSETPKGRHKTKTNNAPTDTSTTNKNIRDSDTCKEDPKSCKIIDAILSK